MAVFEKALAFVLANEGVLREDSTDPGGITKYGISLRFLREVPPETLRRAGIFEPINEQTIRELTSDQAMWLYRLEFWEKAPFSQLQNQKNANYIFDMCVNHRLAQGIKIAQRAVCDCQKNREYLLDDGIMGAKTIQGINQAGFLLQYAMIGERSGFYRMLARVNPNQAKDLNGWLNRACRI
jgi:lysozyme family protein